MTKHRFKSIDGAVRRVRRLEKVISIYESIGQRQRKEMTLLAKLASKEPEFFNPLEVFEAEAIRDRILGRKP